MLVVAGDVGGTNARLRLARSDEAGLVTLADRTYPSGNYSGFFCERSCSIMEPGFDISVSSGDEELGADVVSF